MVVRHVPDLSPKWDHGRDAFFPTTPANQVHRRHAIFENVHADLKASARPRQNEIARTVLDRTLGAHHSRGCNRLVSAEGLVGVSLSG